MCPSTDPSAWGQLVARTRLFSLFLIRPSVTRTPKRVIISPGAHGTAYGLVLGGGGAVVAFAGRVPGVPGHFSAVALTVAWTGADGLSVYTAAPKAPGRRPQYHSQ